MHHTIVHYTAPFNSAPYNIALQCTTVLHYTTLHCNTLHGTTLHITTFTKLKYSPLLGFITRVVKALPWELLHILGLFWRYLYFAIQTVNFSPTVVDVMVKCCSPPGYYNNNFQLGLFSFYYYNTIPLVIYKRETNPILDTRISCSVLRPSVTLLLPP